jgi:hypothetical protein
LVLQTQFRLFYFFPWLLSTFSSHFASCFQDRKWTSLLSLGQRILFDDQIWNSPFFTFLEDILGGMFFWLGLTVATIFVPLSAALLQRSGEVYQLSRYNVWPSLNNGHTYVAQHLCLLAKRDLLYLPCINWERVTVPCICITYFVNFYTKSCRFGATAVDIQQSSPEFHEGLVQCNIFRQQT